jgi:hypothetical protein
LIFFVTALSAQSIVPLDLQNNEFGYRLIRNRDIRDSGTAHKWFVTSYTGINAGYGFFGHGNASFVSAPITFQLNRRLNNNLYAFASVTAAPTYLSFNRAFMATDNNTTNKGMFYRPGNLSMYSAATMGLMYINDARTFSISGSVSVEKNDYPWLYGNSNVHKQNNTLYSK